MKPKAQKYRIRRAKTDVDEGDVLSAQNEGDETSRAQPAFTASVQETPVEGSTNIDDIRKEGLSARQLRMARKLAQKEGLEPETDYDAVRLLRERGINPFGRGAALDLIASNRKIANAPSPIVLKHPEVARGGKIDDMQRARDVMDIQRDIVHRRRRRAFFLCVRLLFFVLLPTFVAGYYYYAIATPMYSTKSEFVIQTADQGGGSKLGGLFSGMGLATSQDSITVQGYLQSRDAMLRLDADEGFKQHFSQPDIDLLQRIELDSSNETAYKLFRKRVLIGYDPTEGILKMEVIAADPHTSVNFAEKLISYAEQQVDQLTARLRSDQMAGAEAGRREANEKMFAAQKRIVDLQEKLGVISPESEVQAVFGQISLLENELLTERISLQTFLGNETPNPAKVRASERKIVELEKLIREKRAQLTKSSETSGSLARVAGELLVAQADLETRQEILAQAEAQFETARQSANKQVRYLSVGVKPIAPDEPTYPRAFENTLLALLIFSGIYLMLSLTVSILREQV